MIRGGRGVWFCGVGWSRQSRAADGSDTRRLGSPSHTRRTGWGSCRRPERRDQWRARV